MSGALYNKLKCNKCVSLFKCFIHCVIIVALQSEILLSENGTCLFLGSIIQLLQVWQERTSLEQPTQIKNLETFVSFTPFSHFWTVAGFKQCYKTFIYCHSSVKSLILCYKTKLLW
jgi:hypothetical protein